MKIGAQIINFAPKLEPFQQDLVQVLKFNYSGKKLHINNFLTGLKELMHDFFIKGLTFLMSCNYVEKELG